MPYRVGGLLYTPATNRSIAAKKKLQSRAANLVSRLLGPLAL